MSIKEKFIDFLNKRKENKAQREIKKKYVEDCEKAERMLQNFSLSLTYKIKDPKTRADIYKSKTIEKSNVEFALVGFAWKAYTNAQRISILIKASERFFPDVPLSLKNVILDDDKNSVIILKDNVPYINYRALNFLDSLDVIHQLFGYEHDIKENIFKDKMKNFNSIYDFSNSKQLKYLLHGHENYLVNAYSQNPRKSLVEMAVELDCSPEATKMEADEKALYVFENLAYFAPELDYFGVLYKEKFLSAVRYASMIIEETLGDEKKRVENYVKLAHEFYKDKYFKNEKLEDVIKHFQATTNKEIFEDIKLNENKELEM